MPVYSSRALSGARAVAAKLRKYGSKTRPPTRFAWLRRGCALLVVLTACSSDVPSPAPSGVLAPVVDSILQAHPRLTCSNEMDYIGKMDGLRPCWGTISDTSVFFHMDSVGMIHIVGRDWDVSHAEVFSQYVSVIETLGKTSGQGEECAFRDGASGSKWRRHVWDSTGFHLAVTGYARGGGEGKPWMQLIHRLGPSDCDASYSPPRLR